MKRLPCHDTVFIISREPTKNTVLKSETLPKTPINFSALQCTYLGEDSFQYHLGLVRKKENEKWLLRTSVQCI